MESEKEEKETRINELKEEKLKALCSKEEQIRQESDRQKEEWRKEKKELEMWLDPKMHREVNDYACVCGEAIDMDYDVRQTTNSALQLLFGYIEG